MLPFSVRDACLERSVDTDLFFHFDGAGNETQALALLTSALRPRQSWGSHVRRQLCFLPTG